MSSDSKEKREFDCMICDKKHVAMFSGVSGPSVGYLAAPTGQEKLIDLSFNYTCPIKKDERGSVTFWFTESEYDEFKNATIRVEKL